MQAEILQRIVYPTGGYTAFEYEPHDYGYMSKNKIPPQIITRPATIEVKATATAPLDTKKFRIASKQFVRLVGVINEGKNSDLIPGGTELHLKRLTRSTVPFSPLGWTDGKQVINKTLELDIGTYEIKALTDDSNPDAICSLSVAYKDSIGVVLQM